MLYFGSIYWCGGEESGIHFMHEVCHTMRRYLLSVGVVYCQESQMVHRIWKIFLFVGVV